MRWEEPWVIWYSKTFWKSILPHWQSEGDDSDFTYELFSVIIHKGGCYGGHYHVYIRDIDELGKWEPPVRGKKSLFSKKNCIL